MAKNVNITSSAGEAEKKINELTKARDVLMIKKEAKLADYDKKLSDFKAKLEADKTEKITPMDAEITRLNTEITKFQKMREMSLKYEEQMKKMFGDTEE